jgi:ribonucleoside-diphosphate reductase subunit M2
MNDSPAKKLNFEAVGKENLPLDAQAPAADVEIKKPVVQEAKTQLVSQGIKPEEADEPLLQANPNRFVLFPIKYHEVSSVSSRRRVNASRVK